MKKNVSLAAVMLTAVALITAGIAPAQAAGVPTLPAGQNLFALDSNAFQPQLWSVDPTNGDSIAVGSQPASTSYSTGGAQYNPVDGTSYSLIYAPGGTSLFTFDTTTGDYTSVGVLNGDATDGFGLAITNAGEAYTIDRVGSEYTLFSLDLSTAKMTLVGGMGPSLSPQTIAYNPVDDTVYSFNRTNGNVYSVNLSSGLATLDAAKQLTLPTSITCMSGTVITNIKTNTAAFDANGNLWMQTDSCALGDLMVADFATGDVTYLGQFNDVARSKYTNSPNYDFYAGAVFITTDAAALPDTGMSASVAAATVSISAGLLAAGALALVMVRRRFAAK
jgi:DNA-binding beta-propeller fold protein YncE